MRRGAIPALLLSLAGLVTPAEVERADCTPFADVGSRWPCLTFCVRPL